MATQICSFSPGEIVVMRLGVRLALSDYDRFIKTRDGQENRAEAKEMKADLQAVFIKLTEMIEGFKKDDV